MNGFKGNRAPDASEKPGHGDAVFSLTTVQKMLPLVRRIVDDILAGQKTLIRLHPEEVRLDKKRQSLAWPERRRRYTLKDEVAGAENALQNAKEELGGLGLAILDTETGRVGFPTMVNNRHAYFTWQPGEESPRYWHFAEEAACRPIPPAWLKEISLAGKTS